MQEEIPSEISQSGKMPKLTELDRCQVELFGMMPIPASCMSYAPVNQSQNIVCKDGGTLPMVSMKVANTNVTGLGSGHLQEGGQSENRPHSNYPPPFDNRELCFCSRAIQMQWQDLERYISSTVEPFV